MPDETFPLATQSVVATLAGLLRLQARSDLAELLETATARIEQTGYDNWDGGTSYYTLFLEVPLKHYAAIEPQLEKIEKTLSSKLASTIKHTGEAVLNNVSISPVLEQVVPSAAPQKVPEADVKHIWEEGLFRLFLTHVAVHKVAVSNLKQELRAFGVSGFVAHEDIEPSLEWQNEIELALGSMNALVALLTPEFKDSKWTDQEMGVAVGRGLLVIPVKLGLDPYGFIGKNQALSGSLDQPGRLAWRLVRILVNRDATSLLMREALVVALERALSFAASKRVASFLESTTGFTTEQLARMEVAALQNSQVRESFGVPERIKKLVAQNRPAEEEEPLF